MLLRSCALAIVTLPLSGCTPGSFDSFLALFGNRGTTTVVACPKLANPPESVIVALEAAARKDKAAADWTVALAKHEDALDACDAAG